MTIEEYNRITRSIIKCAIDVHKELGTGFTESVYETCMKHALSESGASYKTQVIVPVFFKGLKMDKDFFIDILVEEEVIVELKAVETITPVHEAQLLNYLKLSKKKLGLLLNFNVPLMKNGIKRIINGQL
jgi:GxxExxY protein